jgi:ubiquinone biosynthesis protein
MIKSPSRRIRKAYWTAFVIAMSYFRASLLRRLWGQRWYEQRVATLHIQNAERAKQAILELQGLFIKVGQLLSVMSNFLPEAFQRPLESLQDRLPAQPYPEVRRRILEELGAPPEELFAHFDQTPLATASIGQAHRARLADGTELVIKVQHYGIEGIAQVDLHIIQRLTAVFSWFMHVQGMEYLYGQIRQMIEEELDFANEVRAMETIRVNLAEETGVIVPEVFPAYSTGRVMATRLCEGTKISDLAQLDAWEINRTELAARLHRIWCRMVFKDGYYHADPHPGNLLVTPEGSLVLLDFGATGHLSPALREGIPQLIEATVKNDTESMIEACHTMGFLAEGREADQMARKMIAALRRFLQNEVQMEGLDFRNLQVNPFNNSLTDLVHEIGFKGISSTVQVPKDYVLLNRTVTLLLGLSHTLDPGYNPLDTVRPFAQQYLLQDKGGPMGYVRELLQRNVTNILGLPDDIQKTLRKARAGELEMNSPDTVAGARLIAQALYSIGLLLAGIGAAFFSLRLMELGMTQEARYGFWAAGTLFVVGLWRLARGQ